MSAQKGISNQGRRRFLQGGAALTAGLLLELSPGGRVALASAGTDVSAVFTPNAWVQVTPDNVVRLVVHKFDSGTGVKNALGLIVAEELDADWSKVEVVTPDNPLADAYKHPLWGMHATGGSTSVSLEWDNLRKAGATARAMLVNAAAKQWNVNSASCRTEAGKVIHDASGQSALYGELAAAAATLPVPEDVPLKNVNDFSLIGKQHNSYRV